MCAVIVKGCARRAGVAAHCRVGGKINHGVGMGMRAHPCPDNTIRFIADRIEPCFFRWRRSIRREERRRSSSTAGKWIETWYVRVLRGLDLRLIRDDVADFHIAARAASRKRCYFLITPSRGAATWHFGHTSPKRESSPHRLQNARHNAGTYTPHVPTENCRRSGISERSLALLAPQSAAARNSIGGRNCSARERAKSGDPGAV